MPFEICFGGSITVLIVDYGLVSDWEISTFISILGSRSGKLRSTLLIFLGFCYSEISSVSYEESLEEDLESWSEELEEELLDEF